MEELYSMNIPINSLTGGAHNFSVRVKGQNGTWSKLFVQTIYINDPLCKVYDTIVDSICMGDNYTFGSQTITTAGNYNDTIVVANNCDTVIILTLIVKPLVTPTVAIATNVTLPVCKETNIFFSKNITNGGSSPTYQWKRNGTNVGTGLSTYSPSGTLNNNGDTIVCMITSSEGCLTTSSVSDTLILSLNQYVNKSITDSICSKDSLLFGWIYLKVVGVYSDTVLVSGSCDSILTLNLIVKQSAIAVANADMDTINIGETVIFNTSGSSGNNYLWDFGDGFTSVLSAVTHTYNSAGVFTVILKANSLLGCNDYDTLTIVVNSSVGIDDDVMLNSQINVYPNPIKDAFSVSFQFKVNTNVSVKLYSSNGQIIDQKQLSVMSEVVSFTDLNYEKGVYFLHITANNNKVVKRLVIID
jgi:hypothetical protein